MSILKHLAVLLPAVILLALKSPLAGEPAGITTDPYLWLEDREGKEAIAWVKKHDSATFSEIKVDSNFARFQAEALAIMNANDRIPYGTLMGGYVYNFWQDADHVRGLYRRTSLEEYTKLNPQWETVLDIDSLNKVE